MSHEEQQRRQPAEANGQDRAGDGRAVRYGDVFAVEGELARMPIAPQDAAMMQASEDAVLGEASKGGTAAVMQSAGRRNERLGVVARDEVTEARVPGGRVVTEFVADQPVGQQYIAAGEEEDGDGATSSGAAAAREAGSGCGHGGVVDGTKITIGEALEAAAFSAGDQPVEASDAAAIAAAEARAAGLDEAPPGGLAAQARAAADANAQAERDADKTTLRQVLAGATARLGADKEVERGDAARS